MKNKPPRCPPLHGVFPTPSSEFFRRAGIVEHLFWRNDTLLVEPPGNLKFQISNLRFPIVQTATVPAALPVGCWI